jgi:hypothetical protein
MTDRNQAEIRAARVYSIINDYTRGNMFIQGLAGLFGSGVPVITDVAAVGLYAVMWSDINSVYGHKAKFGWSELWTMIKGSWLVFAADIGVDKLIEQIPVLGIPSNVLAAKILTWRIGYYLGVISALGAYAGTAKQGENAKLIAEYSSTIFPRSVFTLSSPDQQVFIETLAQVEVEGGDSYDWMREVLEARRRR